MLFFSSCSTVASQSHRTIRAGDKLSVMNVYWKVGRWLVHNWCDTESRTETRRWMETGSTSSTASSESAFSRTDKGYNQEQLCRCWGQTEGRLSNRDVKEYGQGGVSRSWKRAGERWWGKDTQGHRDDAKGTEQRVIVLCSVRQRKGNCTEEGKGKAPVYPCCGWVDRNIGADFSRLLTSIWDSLLQWVLNCFCQGESLSSCSSPSWAPLVSKRAAPLPRVANLDSLGKTHTTSSCSLAAQSPSSWLKCSLAGETQQPPNLFFVSVKHSSKNY